MKRAAIAAVMISSSTAGGGVTGVPRPTEPFRQEHVEIRRHLEHVAKQVGALEKASQAESVKLMGEIVDFFEEHIRPHAAWEERALYPAVDQKAGSRPGFPFTASMRYEHKIVARWTGELDAERKRPRPDVRAFARRADNLLGLVVAHFEEEEEVLLPVLDRTMKPDEFRALMHAEAKPSTHEPHGNRGG